MSLEAEILEPLLRPRKLLVSPRSVSEPSALIDQLCALIGCHLEQGFRFAPCFKFGLLRVVLSSIRGVVSLMPIVSCERASCLHDAALAGVSPSDQVPSQPVRNAESLAVWRG